MKFSFVILLVVTLVLIPGITLLTTLHVLLLACFMGVDPTVQLLRLLTPSSSTFTTIPSSSSSSSWSSSADHHTTTTRDFHTQVRERRRRRRRRPAYYEIEESKLASQANPSLGVSSSYQLATVVTEDSSNSTSSSWFRKRKLCRETCCVESVAISLQQDQHKIINTKDGHDLADVTIQHRKPRGPGERYFASALRPDILPCLLPGTIVQIENHFKDLFYFWIELRPRIRVPYVLITSGSDAHSPQGRRHDIGDPLLLKWYGTNPKPITPPHNQDWSYQQYLHKFEPLRLGLSFQLPQQTTLLQSYLEATNYTNPFAADSWEQQLADLQRHGIDFDRDIFVQFDRTLPRKQQLWNALCEGYDENDDELTNNNTRSKISCNRTIPPASSLLPPTHDLYKEISSYKFGVSPPGQFGWDTHRIYELLLLGIVPIISSNEPFSTSGDMFHGLPIIQIPNLEHTITDRQQLIDSIEEWIQDQQQQQQQQSSQDIIYNGWNKLFFQHQRQQILKDSNRQHEIVVRDDGTTTGREYFQAYRYTTTATTTTTTTAKANSNNNLDYYYCEQKGSCEVDETTKQNWKTTALLLNRNGNNNKNKQEEEEEEEEEERQHHQEQWLQAWKRL